MNTIEKTTYGYLLGFYQDNRKQYIPCGDLVELELEAHRHGLILKDNAR